MAIAGALVRQLTPDTEPGLSAVWHYLDFALFVAAGAPLRPGLATSIQNQNK